MRHFGEILEDPTKSPQNRPDRTLLRPWTRPLRHPRNGLALDCLLSWLCIVKKLRCPTSNNPPKIHFPLEKTDKKFGRFATSNYFCKSFRGRRGPVTSQAKPALSPDGGIGRRAGLKHQWGNPCRFDPGSGYNEEDMTNRHVLFFCLHQNPTFLRPLPSRPLVHASRHTHSAVGGSRRLDSKRRKTEESPFPLKGMCIPLKFSLLLLKLHAHPVETLFTLFSARFGLAVRALQTVRILVRFSVVNINFRMAPSCVAHPKNHVVFHKFIQPTNRYTKFLR